MAVQRILLLVAAVAAVALLFGLPRVFEETDEAAVPPVELRDEPTERRAEPPRGASASDPGAHRRPPPPPAPAPRAGPGGSARLGRRRRR